MKTNTIKANELSSVVRHCVVTNSEPGQLDIDTIDELTNNDLSAGSRLETAVRGPPQDVHGAVDRAVTYARRANHDVSTALVRALLETGRDSTAIADFLGADLAAVEEVVGQIVGTADPLQWMVTTGHTEWLREHVHETRHLLKNHQNGQLEVPYATEHTIHGPSGVVTISRPITVDRDAFWIADDDTEETVEMSATAEATWTRDGSRIGRITETETWTVDAACLECLNTLRAQMPLAIDAADTYGAVVNTVLGAALYPEADRTTIISHPQQSGTSTIIASERHR